jgi:hypothetical protein
MGSRRVHICNRLISDEPSKSLSIKTEYKSKAVVTIVNILISLPYDWTV